MGSAAEPRKKGSASPMLQHLATPYLKTQMLRVCSISPIDGRFGALALAHPLRGARLELSDRPRPGADGVRRARLAGRAAKTGVWGLIGGFAARGYRPVREAVVVRYRPTELTQSSGNYGTAARQRRTRPAGRPRKSLRSTPSRSLCDSFDPQGIGRP